MAAQRIENGSAARVWWLGARALGTAAVAKGPDEGGAARVFCFYSPKAAPSIEKEDPSSERSSSFEKGKCRVHEMEDTGGRRKEREG